MVWSCCWILVCSSDFLLSSWLFWSSRSAWLASSSALAFLQFGALVFQLLALAFDLLADLLVLAGDLLQGFRKGQQLIEVVGAGKQRDGAAVVEHLHGAQALLETGPALIVFGLLDIHFRLLLVDFQLLIVDVLLNLGNGPLQQADLGG